MNITEAVRTQSLLAWLTDPDPDPQVTGILLGDARFLADRAWRVLGAGPDADRTESALRQRLGHERHDERLTRLADLLKPCPPPDVAAGWTLCAHAEPWPCVITRAAWIASGVSVEEATHDA